RRRLPRERRAASGARGRDRGARAARARGLLDPHRRARGAWDRRGRARGGRLVRVSGTRRWPLAPVPLAIAYREVLLGAVGGRWLTHDEIAAGVLQAVDADEPCRGGGGAGARGGGRARGGRAGWGGRGGRLEASTRRRPYARDDQRSPDPAARP